MEGDFETLTVRLFDGSSYRRDGIMWAHFMLCDGITVLVASLYYLHLNFRLRTAQCEKVANLMFVPTYLRALSIHCFVFRPTECTPPCHYSVTKALTPGAQKILALGWGPQPAMTCGSRRLVWAVVAKRSRPLPGRAPLTKQPLRSRGSIFGVLIVSRTRASCCDGTS
jgi:hypothetical protein